MMKDLLKQFDYVGKKHGFLITEVTNCSFNIRTLNEIQGGDYIVAANTIVATVSNIDGDLLLKMTGFYFSKKVYDDLWKIVEAIEETFHNYADVYYQNKSDCRDKTPLFGDFKKYIHGAVIVKARGTRFYDIHTDEYPERFDVLQVVRIYRRGGFLAVLLDC